MSSNSSLKSTFGRGFVVLSLFVAHRAHATGAAGQTTFSLDFNGFDGTLVTGQTRVLDVSLLTTTPQPSHVECHARWDDDPDPGWGCGGGSSDEDNQICEDEPTSPVVTVDPTTIVDATAEGCTIGSQNPLTIVAPATPGTCTLHVTARNAVGEQAQTDLSITVTDHVLTFVPINHDPIAPGMVVLAGQTWTWASTGPSSITYVDARFEATGAVALVSQEQPYSANLIALSAGTGKVHASADNDRAGDVDITVVDDAAATKIEWIELTDTIDDAKVVTKLCEVPNKQALFARFTIADGRHGLVPDTKITYPDATRRIARVGTATATLGADGTPCD